MTARSMKFSNSRTLPGHGELANHPLQAWNRLDALLHQARQRETK